MKFTNRHQIMDAKNYYNYMLSSLEKKSNQELEEILAKYQNCSIWKIEDDISFELSIFMKNSLECYLKAVKEELQERVEAKKEPYSKEIDFLKNFINNNSNSIPFEIIGHKFNRKSYRIIYEVEGNERVVFWRFPSELEDLPFDYFEDSSEFEGLHFSYLDYPDIFNWYFATRRISIMCSDGRKMTIVRFINHLKRESIKIKYEEATKKGIAFYPYKFSSEELKHFNEMFFQKIAEAIIEQEQKEKELQEGTKIKVKELCIQRPQSTK